MYQLAERAEDRMALRAAPPKPADTSAAVCSACGAVPRALPDAGMVAVRAEVPATIAAALRRTDTLTARERTIFELLGRGYDNRSLARELALSERTVKRHITAVLAKLRLESRLQAGLAALLTSSCPPAASIRAVPGPLGQHRDAETRRRVSHPAA